MPSKSVVYLGMIAGSIIGGYLPTFFGVDALSFTSLITSGIGGLLGIYLVFKLARS